MYVVCRFRVNILKLHLKEEDWWKQTASKLCLKTPSEDSRKKLLEVYLMFVKIGLVQEDMKTMREEMESKFQQILAKIDIRKIR